MFNQNSGNFKSLSINSTNTFKVYGKEVGANAYTEKYISAPLTVEGGGIIKKDLFVGGAIQIGPGSAEIDKRISDSQSHGLIDSKYNGLIVYDDSTAKFRGVQGGTWEDFGVDNTPGNRPWKIIETNTITTKTPAADVVLSKNNAETLSGKATLVLNNSDYSYALAVYYDNNTITPLFTVSNEGDLLANDTRILGTLNCLTYTTTLANCIINKGLVVTEGAIFHNTLTLMNKPILGATTITASGVIQGGSLTDGTATLLGGALSGATTITASGVIQGGSLTDGTTTLLGGALSGATTITASGVIQGGSLTDGTATLLGGALSGATTITASVATLHNLNISDKINIKNSNNTNSWDIHVGHAPYYLDYDLVFLSNSNNLKGGYISHLTNEAQMNNFTGQHPCHLKNDLRPEDIGLIVSTTNNIINYDNKLKPTINESLPVVEITSKEKDKRVFGVISSHEDGNIKREYVNGVWGSFEEKELINERRTYINSVGEGSMWVSNKNGSLEGGDYIVSSTIPGYGQKQDDDLLRNCTVAKISHDCDFSLVKVKKREIKTSTDGDGKKLHVFDADGLPTYNELDEEEYIYETRFLKADGTISNINDYDFIAMFVGCTYHCG